MVLTAQGETVTNHSHPEYLRNVAACSQDLQLRGYRIDTVYQWLEFQHVPFTKTPVRFWSTNKIIG